MTLENENIFFKLPSCLRVKEALIVTEFELTPKIEMHRCILSTVTTNALVLKHQAISTHSAG